MNFNTSSIFFSSTIIVCRNDIIMINFHQSPESVEGEFDKVKYVVIPLSRSDEITDIYYVVIVVSKSFIFSFIHCYIL